MSNIRRILFVSDRTGLSAEGMGKALLEQFDGLQLTQTTYGMVNTVEKMQNLVAQINQFAQTEGARPIVFSSVVDEEINKILLTANALHISLFDAFLNMLEKEFGVQARHQVRSRVENMRQYDLRMEAVNFSLNHDDGSSEANLKEADVILMGVSRSGKTPTCLYLAMQYGIRAANYPLTPDDFESTDLPRMIAPYKHKLYGLTIDPNRLHEIREERRANSKYSNINTCRQEVADAQAMFRRFGIPSTNTTHKSVEELAITIMQECRLKRRV